MTWSKNLFNEFKHGSFFERFLYLSLLIAFLVSVLYILKPLTYDYYPDFSCYYYGAKTFLGGGNPYTDEGGSFGAFVYPPPALLLFIPFTLFTFDIAQKIFTLLSLISFILSLHLLISFIKLKLLSKSWLFLYILAFNFFPAKYTLGMGQINNFILLLLVAFILYYLKKKEAASGIILAIATVIKTTPIVLLLFLVIKRKWKTIFTLFTTLVVVFAISLYVIKAPLFLYFFQKTLPSQLGSWPKDYYNQSITGFLARYLSNKQIRYNLKNLITLLLVVYSSFVSWKFVKSKEKDILVIGVFITLGLILNGISWQHHFVWLLIPLFLTLEYIRNFRVSYLYYFILFICYFLVAFNLKHPAMYPAYLQSHVFYGSIVLLFLQLNLLLKKSYDSRK